VFLSFFFTFFLTPDGRLIAIRPSGAVGGPAGTFLISVSGGVSQLSGLTQYYGLEQPAS